MPDDQARDDLGRRVDRRARRRPARHPGGGRAAPREVGALRGRLPRRHQPGRPRGDPDPVRRGAGHRDERRDAGGGREALHARRAAPRADGRGRRRVVSRRGSARATRPTCSARWTWRRSASAASGSSSTTASRPRRTCSRSCSGRSGSRSSPRTRSRATATRGRARARDLDRPGEAARLGGRRRLRRRLRPRGRADLPDRRAGARGAASSRRCCSTCGWSARTAGSGKLAFPVTVTSQVDRLVEGTRLRDHPHAGVAPGADAGRGGGRRRLRRRGRRRLRLPRVPARLRRGREPRNLLELLAPVAAAALGARRRAAARRPSSTGRSRARGR